MQRLFIGTITYSNFIYINGLIHIMDKIEIPHIKVETYDLSHIVFPSDWTTRKYLPKKSTTHASTTTTINLPRTSKTHAPTENTSHVSTTNATTQLTRPQTKYSKALNPVLLNKLITSNYLKGNPDEPDSMYKYSPKLIVQSLDTKSEENWILAVIAFPLLFVIFFLYKSTVKKRMQ